MISTRRSIRVTTFFTAWPLRELSVVLITKSSCRLSRPRYSGGVGDVTHILERVEQGDPKAADELLPLVYDELRRLAAHRMSHEAQGFTLQPTALVHEAWLRLVGNQNPNQAWDGRVHFFAAAAEAMRRILIDRARRRRAVRHGGGQQRVDIQEVDLASTADDDQLLALSEALDQLAAEHKVEAELVKLRYFVGLTIDETAEVLGISPRTAKNYWTHARAWLYWKIQAPVE
jgi:RNA polymerase sigma factor (TIGR02999 family)